MLMGEAAPWLVAELELNIERAKAAGIHRGRTPSVSAAEVRRLKEQGSSMSTITREPGIRRASACGALVHSDRHTRRSLR